MSSSRGKNGSNEEVEGDHTLQAQILSLKQEQVKIDARKQEILHLYKQYQQDLEILQKEYTEKLEELPLLEQNKKEAASQKKFKEAAEIVWIKQNQNRQDEIQSEMK